jgi:dihydrofolate reductase
MKKLRKIIVLSFITLDGVMQAPGGPEEDTSGGFKYGGWVFPYFDESLGKIMDKQMRNYSDLLLGRKTFEIFAAYWPYHETDWPGINKVTKYIASNTLSTHEWSNSVFLKGNVVEHIKALKQQNGTDLQVHGSGNLIQTLLKNDLIDEFWLKIIPITLGNGKRLFSEGTIPSNFKLLENEITPSGVIVASYRREGKIKTGSFVN